MRPKGIFAATALLVYWVLHPGPMFAQNVFQPFAQNIIAMMMAPIKSLGESRESIKTKLGPWISLKTRKVANKHNSEQIDDIYTIVYDGLTANIYHAVVYKKEMLVAVRMTRNFPKILPELVGSKKEMIELRFGPAKQTEKGSLLYSVEDEIGEDLMRVTFKNGTVIAVEWSYYVD